MAGASDLDPAIAAARERTRRLANGVAKPLTTLTVRVLAGMVVNAVAVAVLQVLVRDPVLAWLDSILVVATGTAFALRSTRDADTRLVADLFQEHYVRERADWRRETGDDLPRGYGRIERWLDSHPAPDDHRPSALIALGRLDDAERELAAESASTPDTPTEAFDREIVRLDIALYRGEPVDLARLRELWDAIPAGPTRRLKALCLALLVGQLAVDRGDDPVKAIVAERDRFGPAPYAMSSSVRLRERVLTLTVPSLAVGVVVRLLVG